MGKKTTTKNVLKSSPVACLELFSQSFASRFAFRSCANVRYLTRRGALASQRHRLAEGHYRRAAFPPVMAATAPPLFRWRRQQPSANRCLRACPLRHPACQAAPRRANPLAIRATTHPSSFFFIFFAPFLHFSSFTSNPISLFLFCVLRFVNPRLI